VAGTVTIDEHLDGTVSIRYGSPLGNRLRRFRLSHRLHNDFPSLSQIKAEEGSMNSRPDN